MRPTAIATLAAGLGIALAGADHPPIPPHRIRVFWPYRAERRGFWLSAIRNPPAEALMPETPDDQLYAGRYRISALLGKGERKRTYLAWDTKAHRQVALAVVAPG